MKPTILSALLVALVCQSFAQVLYVQQGATGNGTSWDNAMGDLTTALAQAAEGTQIWVAEGTYHPTLLNDRSAAFTLTNDLQIYGGFTGTETSVEQRDWLMHPTILSGEIGAPGIADNSYNVLLTKNVTGKTVIDGFTVTDGNANGEAEDANRIRCGGGLYNDGSNGNSKPSITNCIFKNNRGRDGAAIYNNGRGGESSPTLVNCIFLGNEAGLDGGAIYNDGRIKGTSNPILKNCSFERNVGTYGGAIFNATEDGTCNLVLENCAFKENTAFLRGGAVFNMSGNNNCSLELLDCIFEGNYPDDQSKVFTNNTARTVAYQINKP